MALQTLSGKQIRQNSLEDRHVKSKFSEAVLDIKWGDAGHAAEVLSNKVIVDYVQYVGEVIIADKSNRGDVTLSLDVSTNTIPGVVLDTPIRMRDINGDPIQADGKEIVGKIISCNGATPDADGTFDYTIAFYKADGGEYTFAANTTIEFLYPIKTTLWDASETFASNERFIDGAVDIRTRLDIEQLAKDVYGAAYKYNANGTATQSETLAAMLQRLTHGSIAETTPISGTNIIDEVYAARDGHASLLERLVSDKTAGNKALSDYIALILSQATGEGTSQVGHYVDPSTHLFKSSKLNEILDEVGALVLDAEGSKESITERLAVSIRESGVLVDNEKLHTHGKFAFPVLEDATTFEFTNLPGCSLDATTLTNGIDDIEVYYNGNLQAENIHYKVILEDGFIKGIDLAPENINTGDVVILKWTIYNKYKA